MGVEETKENKRRLPRMKRDKEAERQFMRAQIKEAVTKCRKEKSREELKLRKKYKLNPAYFQMGCKITPLCRDRGVECFCRCYLSH